MFSLSNNNNGGLSSIFESPTSSMQTQIQSSVGKLSESITSQTSHKKRQEYMSRMRSLSRVRVIPYQEVKSYAKFKAEVQAETNPYSLLLTLFHITDITTWRQYLPHLQSLIQQITNIIEETNGSILEQLSSQYSSQYLEHFHRYTLHERLSNTLHLSDRRLQNHLLILVHAIIVHNAKFSLVDEEALSISLLHRHNYETGLREEVLWLLTRMRVSPNALLKLMNNFPINQGSSCLMPTLIIFANFIHDHDGAIIEDLIQEKIFQQILEEGLFSPIYQNQRESVLVCNNILSKTMNSFEFLINQSNLIAKISSLNNQQSIIFLNLIQSNH